MSALVTVTRAGEIAHLRLARPEKLNALSLELLAELAAAAHRLRADRSLRAVVLAGEGDSFCAGLDMAAVTRRPAGIAAAFVPRPWRGTNLFQEAVWSLRRIPVPVVAAVHGHCYGGGLQIALGADLRLTTPDARWSVMEGRWGLIPDMAGVHALSQVVGIDVAKRLTMTAETITGEEAVRLGLAGELSQDPLSDATRLAEQLATRSPDALAAAKRLFDRTWHRGPRATLAAERRAQVALLLGRNTRIARAAARSPEPLAYADRPPRLAPWA